MSINSAIKKLPSIEYLRSCFEYNHITGDLIWKRRPRNHFNTDRGFSQTNSRFTGKKAGSLDKDGYLIVRISGINYRLSRIAWKIHHGNDPEFEIDHIDTIRNHDSISNLRDVDHEQNALNRNMPSTNSSGFMGVHYCNDAHKFRASIRSKGMRKHLGLHQTAIQAHEAYKAEAERIYGGLKRT